ncbi:MAG: hypothetical protein ACNA7H_02425 [Desulfotignum sp.]
MKKDLDAYRPHWSYPLPPVPRDRQPGETGREPRHETVAPQMIGQLPVRDRLSAPDAFSCLETVATSLYTSGRTSFQDVIKVKIRIQTLEEELITLNTRTKNLQIRILELLDLPRDDVRVGPPAPMPPNRRLLKKPWPHGQQQPGSALVRHQWSLAERPAGHSRKKGCAWKIRGRSGSGCGHKIRTASGSINCL